MSKENNENVTFEDVGGELKISVRGKVYENFRRIAEAMNSVSWTDSDNTASTICDIWICDFLRRVAYAPDESRTCDVTDLTTDLQDSLDTGYPDGSSADKARRRELREAFDAIAW